MKSIDFSESFICIELEVYSDIVMEYLERIGVQKDRLGRDLGSMKILQRNHLLKVPFENLDIHWKRPIVLDTEKFYEKIVVKGRGGFCYELNGSFNELLKGLGFETYLVSARVFSGVEKGHGQEFDHAAIIVRLEGERYLVDVGFGAFTTEPLRFVLDEEQNDPSGTFMMRKRVDDYFEVMKRQDGIWRSEYIFKDVPRELSEFAEMCDFQQYSPGSHFRKGKLCSIMTEDGRKTLTDKSFIVTSQNEKTEHPVVSDADFYSLLQTEFSIVAERI